MSEKDPLEALRKMNPHLSRPITENQACSFLENGFTREEIAAADQAFCKRWEDVVLKHDPEGPATLRQMIRLSQFVDTDPAYVQCDHFDSNVFRYNDARKLISEHLRNTESKYHDAAYTDFCKKNRFKR